MDGMERVFIKTEMSRYRLDELIEYSRTKRGRENVALTLLAASCVAGVFVINRL
jgi:hypothetical protein